MQRGKSAWFVISATCCGLLLAAAAVPAAAMESTVPALDESLQRWAVAGYGTLARSWDDTERLAPIRDLSQRPADHLYTGPTWRLDSRVALQASYRHSPEWTVLGQVVARDQVDNSASSHVERAYAEWAPGQWRWRVGRVGYDAFLMSDHRNLGFSGMTVRPPPEFYGWVPNYSVDGADLTHEVDDGDARWRVRFQAGNSRTSLPLGDAEFEFDSEDLWSMTISRDRGPWRLKGGVSEFRIEHDPVLLAPLHAGLTAVAAAGVPGISEEAAALRGNAGFAGAKVSYTTIGIAYDDGVLTAQGELGLTRASSDVVTHGRSGYLTVGRRIGDWQPYLGYAVSRPGNALTQSRNDWAAIGQRSLQYAALDVINSTRIDQRTATAGVRWDLARRVALKLQWDHVHIRPDGYALWFRDLDFNKRASSVNLGTLAVDFVF